MKEVITVNLTSSSSFTIFFRSCLIFIFSCFSRLSASFLTEPQKRPAKSNVHLQSYFSIVVIILRPAKKIPLLKEKLVKVLDAQSSRILLLLRIYGCKMHENFENTTAILRLFSQIRIATYTGYINETSTLKTNFFFQV